MAALLVVRPGCKQAIDEQAGRNENEPYPMSLENSTTAKAQRLRRRRRPKGKERGLCAGRAGTTVKPSFNVAAGSAWTACLEVVSG